MNTIRICRNIKPRIYIPRKNTNLFAHNKPANYWNKIYERKILEFYGDESNNYILKSYEDLFQNE